MELEANDGLVNKSRFMEGTRLHLDAILFLAALESMNSRFESSLMLQPQNLLWPRKSKLRLLSIIEIRKEHSFFLM